MRADARSLLDRLGRSDFAYKEFADRFSDLELWPLFEALLKDPRLFQQELSLPVDAGEAVTAPGIAAARPAGSRADAPAQNPAPSGSVTLAQLFDRYESGGGAGVQGSQGQDVRAMLRRLSDLDARGEL